MNGGYYPSFYHIEIYADDSVVNITEKDFSRTVIHEGIHFLQDLFTTFGLSRSDLVYKNIAYIHSLPRNTIINLPIRFYDLFGKESKATINNKLFKLYENFCNEKDYGNKINLNEFDDARIVYRSEFVLDFKGVNS